VDRRTFLVSSSVVLAGGAVTSSADESPRKDTVIVEVEGQLDSLIQSENSKSVNATIRAGGGVFVIDSSQSNAARKELERLARKYIKSGSTIVTLPRLMVKGRLEFRASKVVGNQGRMTEGAGMWVLVADSVQTATASKK
jgi:hypothetical protein